MISPETRIRSTVAPWWHETFQWDLLPAPKACPLLSPTGLVDGSMDIAVSKSADNVLKCRGLCEIEIFNTSSCRTWVSVFYKDMVGLRNRTSFGRCQFTVPPLYLNTMCLARSGWQKYCRVRGTQNYKLHIVSTLCAGCGQKAFAAGVD